MTHSTISGMTISEVYAGEEQLRQVADLNVNAASLEALLLSPETTAQECVAIRRVLGMSATA